MEYLIHIAILVTLYGMLGLSLNLVVGETGLLSLAQAAFYGLGAYSTALLMVNEHTNFFVAVGAGILISGIVALIIGLVFSRFKGEYYALGTLGFGVIVYSIFLNWKTLTNGPLGLALVYGICIFINRSSFGRVLKAIREDEEVAEVFGYKTLYFKLLIFVISATLASIAGALFGSYLFYIDPTSFSVDESIFILSVVILGGLGSTRGVMLGALLLIVLPEALRFVGFPSDIAAQMRQLVYGVALISLMLFRPQGLLGNYRL